MEAEDVRLRVRARLSRDRVRLWEQPYTADEAGDSALQELAKNYAADLKLEEGVVKIALEYLQQHSIQRAKSNDVFKESGVAMLRITTTAKENNYNEKYIDTKLDILGSELMEKVANEFNTEVIRIKLIHRGKIIKPDLSLEAQDVKNSAQILVIILTGTPESLGKDADMYMIMNNARKDAELMTQDLFGESYMQLEDQSGNQLNLPKNKRRALIIAMTLHERGKTAIKSNDYSLALILLLEADKHFSECNTEILQSVDNYALLNLDIAWCYLCLKSINHILDAEARLTACEKSFHKTYGKNLERLVALKGTSGGEKALFVRLHLLQGIASYHANKRDEAKRLLLRAENELNCLKIDENSLCTLVEMGYTMREARMGLRASEGNVKGAVDFITKRRIQQEAQNKKAMEEHESRVLGLCDDKKQFVSLKVVQMLVDMGYSKNIAVLALKKSNNIIPSAIQIIQEQPELLKMTDLPKSLSGNNFNVDPDIIAQLINCGYAKEMAVEALKRTSNDLNAALDLLIKSGGIIVDYLDSDVSGNVDGAGPSSGTIDRHTRKKLKKMKAAFARLSEGIDNTGDDYLDLSLTQEEEFLNQYKEFLK